MATAADRPPELVQGGMLLLAAGAVLLQAAAGLPPWVGAVGLVAAALAFVLGGARELVAADLVSAGAWLVGGVALVSLAAGRVTVSSSFETIGYGLLVVGGGGLVLGTLVDGVGS